MEGDVSSLFCDVVVALIVCVCGRGVSLLLCDVVGALMCVVCVCVCGRGC